MLTGFMGTGKSSVGRLLAKRLGFRFVDTDTWIEARAGRTIPQIFHQDGEAAFRQMETAAAQALAAETDQVIATGGRLMLDDENAAALGRHGRVFCLTAAPDDIIARLSQDGGGRPLLDVPHPEARISRLLQERASGYGRFPQINTSGKTIEQVVEEIMQCISQI